MNQQSSQIGVTSFGDPQRSLLFAAGVLARNQAKPSRKLPPVVECAAVGDSRNDCGCGDWTYSFDFCNTLAKLVLLKRDADAQIDGRWWDCV